MNSTTVIAGVSVRFEHRDRAAVAALTIEYLDRLHADGNGRRDDLEAKTVFELQEVSPTER